METSTGILWNRTTEILEWGTTTLAPQVVGKPVGRPQLPMFSFYVLSFVYVFGIVGNVSALVILFIKDKRRNRKHLLMLRCLALNDLVALLGMSMQMYASKYMGEMLCCLRVVWRLFGLFSGCVAIVMAAERWLALTRPFLYQKHVTYPMIVRCMLILWLAALTLTFLPFVGFGIYYKGNSCVRYRDATEPTDIAYAYVWFFFGTILCLSIVCCNLAVARALRRLGIRNRALRRVSKASTRTKPLLNVTGPPPEVGSTAEERAFAKLMAMLSISFLLCWMPQMLSIPLAQYVLTLPKTAVLSRKIIVGFQMTADVLLCLHFTLDPYIYVLLRMPRPRFQILKPLCRLCRPASSRSSSFTGTDQQGNSGEPPGTPITEAPSTPVSEVRESQLVTLAI